MALSTGNDGRSQNVLDGVEKGRFGRAKVRGFERVPWKLDTPWAGTDRAAQPYDAPATAALSSCRREPQAAGGEAKLSVLGKLEWRGVEGFSTGTIEGGAYHGACDTLGGHQMSAAEAIQAMKTDRPEPDGVPEEGRGVSAAGNARGEPGMSRVLRSGRTTGLIG